MTKDEALRLALEALEKLWGIIDDIDTYGDMAKADEKLYRTLVERRQRQRFEETGISTDGYKLHGGAITAIKAALEAKDEPVAWISPTELLVMRGNALGGAKDWRVNVGLKPEDGDVGLYTAPPQRKPLTDGEIEACLHHVDEDGIGLFAFARAIEAAHGIKGEA